jgi:plasmid maintenance system antidote protein VapI
VGGSLLAVTPLASDQARRDHFDVQRARRAKWVQETSPAELADKCDGLFKKGMTGTEIADHLGLSKPHVNNLLRVRRDLALELWEKFAKGKLPTDAAFKLARVKDKQEQVRLYEAGYADAGQVRMSKVQALRRACMESDRSDEWKRGARDALDCLLRNKPIAGIRPR